MAGVINRPVAAEGIIAFQDRESPETFEYFPSSAQAVLGETLESFHCKYYGIGAQPHWVQAGPGKYLDLAGGVVDGKARFDATAAQLDALRAEIQKSYGVDDPLLVPARLKDVKATPIFASGIAKLGGNSAYAFPTAVAVGESFNFNIDSGNSLFPQMIASLSQNSSMASAPTVAMNLTGKLELFGEKFTARIRADLKQVWEYVRDQAAVGAKLGWFNFGSDFDRIAQNLQKENIIQVEYIEGRADSEFGLQLLESTRKVFEAINAQITTGEGMFRFEPNPDPQVPKDPKESWFASLAPWSVSVNLSFIRNAFKQSITFDEVVTFQGIFTIEVHSSMNLGMICSPQTANLFHDLTLGENGCITREKIQQLQQRISGELIAKEQKIAEYEKALLEGKIDLKTYETLVAMLNERMLTESHPEDRRTAADLVREVEEYAMRRHGVDLAALRAAVGMPVQAAAGDEFEQAFVMDGPGHDRVVVRNARARLDRERGVLVITVGDRTTVEHAPRVGERYIVGSEDGRRFPDSRCQAANAREGTFEFAIAR